MSGPNVTLPDAVANYLQEQTVTIYETYINGNKSTACAMLEAMPIEHRAYMGMSLYIHGLLFGHHIQMQNLVIRITKP